jgi:hypothetical protein
LSEKALGGKSKARWTSKWVAPETMIQMKAAMTMSVVTTEMIWTERIWR